MVMCVGSFLPFQTTYYINGHHYMAGELHRRGVRSSIDFDSAPASNNNQGWFKFSGVRQAIPIFMSERALEISPRL